MEKHRNSYPLIQIYRAKIKMLFGSVWCNRILSTHYGKTFRISHSICQATHRDCRERPENYYKLQEEHSSN